MEVTEAREGVAICATYQGRLVGGAFASKLPEIFGPRRAVPKPLRAEDAAYPPPLSADQSSVKMDDRINEITDREFP